MCFLALFWRKYEYIFLGGWYAGFRLYNDGWGRSIVVQPDMSAESTSTEGYVIQVESRQKKRGINNLG